MFEYRYIQFESLAHSKRRSFLFLRARVKTLLVLEIVFNAVQISRLISKVELAVKGSYKPKLSQPEKIMADKSFIKRWKQQFNKKQLNTNSNFNNNTSMSERCKSTFFPQKTTKNDDIFATEDSQLKEKDGFPSPKLCKQRAGQLGRATSLPKPQNFNTTFRPCFRRASVEIDYAGRDARFQRIGDLDADTRRLLEIDIIEPLNFDQLKYRMDVFGK